MKSSVNDFCPCGSTKKYKKCCKIFHDKIEIPKTALQLMKSRYSGFAVSNVNYIISTTYEKNPEFTNDLKCWEKDILDFCRYTKFERLEILESLEGDKESFVTFKAVLFQDKNDISFIEKSRFLKVEEKWLYVDGQFIDEGKK